MSELDGVKMRVIALDEIMKCCQEIGRNSDNQQHKDFARELFQVARTRHEFLNASRTDSEKA
jgi:predicted nucleotidyltransferase